MKFPARFRYAASAILFLLVIAGCAAQLKR